MIRADREDANRPLPIYVKSLVGGWSSLRGFTAGAFTGDTAVTGSLEVRVPYLDLEVVDTVLSLPDVAKLGDVRADDPYGRTYRDTGAKRVLIDVGRQWLPRGTC